MTSDIAQTLHDGLSGLGGALPWVVGGLAVLLLESRPTEWNPRGVYDREVRFSERERHIIKLCDRGYSEAMIARNTGYTVNTVKNYKRFLRDKLNAESTPHMVAQARRLQLI